MTTPDKRRRTAVGIGNARQQRVFESLLNALYGLTSTPEEYSTGRDRVAVLSYGTWIEHFGGDRDIVGGVIRLNGQPYTVVGVMPPEFAPRLMVMFRERGIWTPKVWRGIEQRIRGARYYNAVARLRPGVTVQQAQAEFDGIAQRLAHQDCLASRRLESPERSGWVVGPAGLPAFGS